MIKNENLELLQSLYQDSDMGIYTLKELTSALNNKDNKIKNVLIEEIKQYENFKEQTKLKIEQNNEIPKENSGIAKMSSMFGIKKEVFIDNSDSSIAQSVIQGLTMGTVNTEAKISKYNNADIETKKIANNFLKFQQQEIENLKKFL